MDSKYFTPGIGRGGRGAALQQLLKNTLHAGDGDAGISKIQGVSHAGASTGIQNLAKPPGLSSMQAADIPSSSGRGQIVSQLFKASGRGFNMGRGFSLTKNTPADQETEHIHSHSSKGNLPQEMNGHSSNSSVSSVNNSIGNLSLKQSETISYKGDYGNRSSVRANCIRLKYQNNAVYQYSVNFSSPIDSRNMRFHLLNQHQDTVGTTKAFDGSLLYLPKQLRSSITKLKSTRLTDSAEITITITFTKAIDPASTLLIPFYSIVLRRCMSALRMCAVGRNHYDPQSGTKVNKFGLNLWPGYVTAIRSFEGGLLLNIDVSHKVLRNETAHSVMKNIYERTPNQFKENCSKELVGSVVLTRYNNKNYRIDDIAWNITPTDTFTNSKGESIAFKDYYRIQYKIDIKDPMQPMLIHRPKKKTQRSQRIQEGRQVEICLVPELCYLTGLSDSLRNDFRAMKEIKDLTCVPPSERNASIEQFLYRIQTSDAAQNELLKWGLQLDTGPAQIDARILPPEIVLGGKEFQFSAGTDANFSKEVGRAKVLLPVHLENWLLCCTQKDFNKAQKFCQKMIEVANNIGIKVRNPEIVTLRDDRSTTYKDAIASRISTQVQLVVCLFPTSRDDRYRAIKKLCCVDMPVPSQVIISRTLPDDCRSGKFRSVTLKIAMQINCKLGGELWAVSLPFKNLMVCGIDVYHDATGRGKSVAAFVASLSRNGTRWYSNAVMQEHHQEVIDGLKHCFTEAIKKYYDVNHFLPERIIVYRDGVGDGQLRHVAEYEVPQLISCFSMFEGICNTDYNPKFTVVIVSKRINLKFFQENKSSLENPGPGTIIDHTVTRQNWPDFFLVSQHVRHGTVSPTHYIVIHGHNELKPDHIQRLSYKLAHMYYNWPGTIRVPAPCQYAHKLAYLLGQSVKCPASNKLSDRLFYL